MPIDQMISPGGADRPGEERILIDRETGVTSRAEMTKRGLLRLRLSPLQVVREAVCLVRQDVRDLVRGFRQRGR